MNDSLEKPEQNVRQIINGYSNRIINVTNLSLDEASQMMVELTAWLGNINDIIGHLEDNYNLEYARIIEQEDMTASKAKVMVAITDQYKALREAKAYFYVATEMIKSLKYRCRAMSDEFMHSGKM
jgi:hypothetical protein